MRNEDAFHADGWNSMARRHLRIYYGPNDRSQVSCSKLTEEMERVDIPLSDLVATLVDAVRKNRAWVDDFRDEKVAVSMDLYEVIHACQHYRRPSA